MPIYWPPPAADQPPVMTPEERARHAYQTIEAFGWSITHRGTVPDDGWPIDIIAKAIRDALSDKR